MEQKATGARNSPIQREAGRGKEPKKMSCTQLWRNDRQVNIYKRPEPSYGDSHQFLASKPGSSRVVLVVYNGVEMIFDVLAFYEATKIEKIDTPVWVSLPLAKWRHLLNRHFPDSTLRGNAELGDNNQVQVALVIYLCLSGENNRREQMLIVWVNN